MAIGGAFLGGGVEVVPAGSCKLELEILTEDRANLTATFTIKGTSTYTVTAGADGRAVYTVPAGQTYTVSVNTTGYDNIASQTVIAESGTVRYVRFEAIAGRVKRTGDTMTGTLAVVGGASIDTNGQVVGKKLRTTADIHLGSSPSSYAVVNDGWIQNRTLEETKADLGVTSKQDKLTAGTNITISGTTISAKDTTYDVATQSANGLMSSADKTKLDGVDSALAGKVSKSGDTMTGDLIKKSTQYENNNFVLTRHVLGNYQFNDKNDELSGYVRRLGSTANQSTLIGCVANVGGKTVSATVEANIGSSGDTYGSAPSWSVGTNDNSDKILTIKMANSLPSLVHTTGNETIAGSKRFSQGLIRQHGAISAGSVPTSDQYVPIVNIQDSSGTDFGYIRMFMGANSKLRLLQIEVNKLNDDGSTPENSFLQLFAEDENGPARATAPTTPTNASGTEIATAGWVRGLVPNSKWQSFSNADVSTVLQAMSDIRAGDQIIIESATMTMGSATFTITNAVLTFVTSTTLCANGKVEGSSSTYLLLDGKIIQGKSIQFTITNFSNKLTPTLTGFTSVAINQPR